MTNDIAEIIRKQMPSLQEFIEQNKEQIDRLMLLIDERKNNPRIPTVPVTDRRKRRAAKRRSHESSVQD